MAIFVGLDVGLPRILETAPELVLRPSVSTDARQCDTNLGE